MASMAVDPHTDPPWLVVAYRELGVKERAGPADHPRIVEYLKATRIAPKLHHDETPWCAAFVSWALEASGIASTRSAAARSYLAWGEAIEQPKRGCIAVLTRPGADHAGAGHVGFYAGSSDEDVLLLGGNQNNAVSMRLYDRARVLGYRWPVLP